MVTCVLKRNDENDGKHEPIIKLQRSEKLGKERVCSIHLGLKTDENISVPTHSVFYFCPSVSIFVGFRFRIYESRNEVSPSVFEKSRFYMELTRIYSVFHLVFNLHKIYLKIDILKNIPITKYAC